MSQEDFKNDFDYELENEDCELAIESVLIVDSGSVSLAMSSSTDEISNSVVVDVTPSINPVSQQSITLPIEGSAASLTSPK